MGRRKKIDLKKLSDDDQKSGEMFRKPQNGDLHELVSVKNYSKPDSILDMGFYYQCRGVYFFKRLYGSDGFEKEEVRQIAPQVEETSKYCAADVKDDYVLVKCNEGKFYVYIDDKGFVFVPELVESVQDGKQTSKTYGRTENPEKVLGLLKKLK
jgi:hypothetical protein